MGKAEKVGNNDAAAAEDERRKERKKGQTTTYPYVSILVAWKKLPSRIPESQQRGLIEGRFVIDLQGARIYTGLSRWYFCFFPCSGLLFEGCSVLVVAQEVGKGSLC